MILPPGSALAFSHLHLPHIISARIVRLASDMTWTWTQLPTVAVSPCHGHVMSEPPSPDRARPFSPQRQALPAPAPAPAPTSPLCLQKCDPVADLARSLPLPRSLFKRTSRKKKRARRGTMNGEKWKRNRKRQKSNSQAIHKLASTLKGSRTPAACLEGKHDNRFTISVLLAAHFLGSYS
ncbi:hypothetical protein BDW22DRAFT_1430062 [Trametopsis cervina]|nr:hypothetical protein BDW22DRAFT_1430062 [Trametopsis cervina]